MAEPEQEAGASARDARSDLGSAGGEVDPEQLQAMLTAARTDADQQKNAADEYLNMLQRVQADFLNYKRRIETEREAHDQAVRADTIRAFLPLVDDLERALAHIPAEVGNEGWAQGFGLIQRNLAATFERLGVKRVGAEGEVFDPNVHEAVAYEEHPTQPEGHVAAVLLPGYQLGERVVRPAQVSVARAAPSEQRGGPSWRPHHARRNQGNGSTDPADLHKPRNIERA